MGKLRCVVLCAMLLAGSYGYGEIKFLREVKDEIVTKNTEFVQSTMEHKRHKLEKKIRKLQDRLAALEFSDEDEDEDMERVVGKKEKILKDIQKYEELLGGLQRLNETLESTIGEVLSK